MPIFADPLYFALLLPTGLVAWRLVRRRSLDRIRFASFADMPARRLTWRIALARLASPVLIAGLVCIVAALARPQVHTLLERQSTDAIAIQAVLDVSGSMARAADPSDELTAADTQGSTRLDVAKQCLADFVRQRPHDLIGLIAFGGYAITRAPLTADHPALLEVLDSVAIPGRAAEDIGTVRADELLTAIGDAIATACARLEPAATKSKITILLTDGGANAGTLDPERATQVARRLGIRIYTIGVGDPPPDAPPADAPTPPDVVRLRGIADATGGRYFRAESARGLARALRDIDELETTRVTTFSVRRRRELFSYVLVPGLGLILIALAINITVRRRLL